MKALSLKNKIEKLGGSAKIVTRELPSGHTNSELVGEYNGYDVEMHINSDGGSSFYTVRKISKRGEYDQGSDYNPGGYTFCNRINDLTWACQ